MCSFATLTYVCCIFFIGYIFHQNRIQSAVSNDLPWVGVTSWPFSKTWATFSSAWNFQAMLVKAYSKYTSKGLPCVIAEYNTNPWVLLPPSKVNWILQQPDHILDVMEPRGERFKAKYTLPVGAHIEEVAALRQWLLRGVGNSTTSAMEEIGTGFDKLWDLDTESWRDVCVFSSMVQIIAPLMHRTFLNQPSSRDPELIQLAMKYHSLIVPTAEWIKVFPSFMHPVVGRFASLPLKYYFAQFTTCAQPLVRQRIADMEHAQEDPTSKHGSPDDLLTFLIKDARTRGYLREDAERKICGELIGAGFAAIYTTAITASSALLNLVTSPPKRAYMELIWSEVNEIAEKNKDPWTKSSLARMYRVDSALRESMRLSTFEAIVLTRLVRQDITLDNTFRLSRGTRIAIPGYCIHRDESLYPKADEYDAFRFLHREGGNLEAPLFDLEDGVKGNVRPKKQSLVTTSETFLVFGHGRQACPGRYLASDTLKLIIAYITLNYELRPTGPRPSNVWFRSMILPPVSARIAVKRRSRPAKLP